ncbi:alpha-galactosidase [bacterium]|nr:alpha-galactosidase [bacterium]
MTDKAIGYVQEIPGGMVFEIGNGWMQRRVHVISGKIGTTSLVNTLNVEEYLEETKAEFEITITGEGQRVTLDFKDFTFEDCCTPNWSDELRTVEVLLETEINDVPLAVSVFYEARADADYLRKWVKVHPCKLDGWTLRSVTLENMKFREMVEGVMPISRYTKTYSNHEDNVHVQPDSVNVDDPNSSFVFGDTSRAVLGYWGYGEGLYFFTESLTGEEAFNRPTGLVMKHHDCVPLTEGLITGTAIIGGYAGPPEIGFKRYNQHLMDNWCAVRAKSIPVVWDTWLVTREGNQPVLSGYDRTLLIDYIDRIKQAGFYDVVQLDLGWEAIWPMRVDSSKFLNGISEIAKRASEAGLDMGYWINPFTCSYWRSSVEDEHPEWTVPDSASHRSGALSLCVMSDYYDYVRDRFMALVTEVNARSIFWDGNDWNIPACSARNHDHMDQNELEIKARKRLAAICGEAHQARADLVISAFNLPVDNHRLCALDQEQIADTSSFPTLHSELIGRQQIYQMTWEHPFHAIRGGWHGVNWHEAGEDNLTKRPLHELFHAEMSMIAYGLAHAGGSIDLKQARPEFMEFLARLFAFRMRFEKYFDTYQHVLGFPDGKSVDGSGHIIDGAGFIVLVNPTEEDIAVKIPLGAPELELSSEKKHVLADWSGLDSGRNIGSAKIDSAPEIELTGLDVKYIGVNIEI